MIMDSWFYVLTINKQVSLVTAISSYPLSIRNGTAWQQIKSEHVGMANFHKQTLQNFHFWQLHSFHLCAVWTITNDRSCRNPNNDLHFWRKVVSEPVAEYKVKIKPQWTILQVHQGSLCRVLLEPLVNKFIWRNFVNCKMGNASRSVISIYVYFKLSTAIASVPSPQLTIVGCEDNIFLANVVISSTVISSIHRRK